MFDPLNDNTRASGTSPTNDTNDQHLLPSKRPAFCFRCGNELTPYTFTLVLKGAFCTTCANESQQRCFDSLESLPTMSWIGFCEVHNGILWLAPELWKHQHCSLPALADARRAEELGEHARERIGLAIARLTKQQRLNRLERFPITLSGFRS